MRATLILAVLAGCASSEERSESAGSVVERIRDLLGGLGDDSVVGADEYLNEIDASDLEGLCHAYTRDVGEYEIECQHSGMSWDVSVGISEDECNDMLDEIAANPACDATAGDWYECYYALDATDEQLCGTEPWDGPSGCHEIARCLEAP